MLSVPAIAVELFPYRGAAKDGGTLEYVFEAGEQNSPNAVTKEKVAEIAADFIATFYRRVGDSGIPHDTGPILARMLFGHDQGPLRQMFFVVLLPDGTVVEPKVEKRL